MISYDDRGLLVVCDSMLVVSCLASAGRVEEAAGVLNVSQRDRAASRMFPDSAKAAAAFKVTFEAVGPGEVMPEVLVLISRLTSVLYHPKHFS